ncbi:MAG: Inositol monophosphatase family protein [Candidatus Magasanikbacteria bacterium GW2011_GWA2_56_11]|uniref:Inositol monophosphatase family protein n=1 Tax=Candidatus Magasanikbacteria bacterium GW2011_GWA2_56_11 TaxID=1619044 RepID=A0A0G1YG98_9BACT|nr:MAG: Inositol monophosphatase family protein [Candidatus Magasanikbacteria bacterium GW2011_GWA2_56_11]
MQDFLHTTIRAAGAIARDYFVRGVTHSEKTSVADLLTEADVAVSDYLIAQIQANYPDHQIHSEERAADINPGARYEWVIDPIDGTRNFALGIPFWAPLVAVIKDGKPFLAAIFNPMSDQLFSAAQGGGAYLNGQRIQVNGVDTLEHGFGVIYRRSGFPRVERYIRAMDELNRASTTWLHNYGSMVAAAHLASGGIDFYLSNSGFDHDLLAPALICSEAGAVVTDADGNPWTREHHDIVIANPRLHPKVLALLK